MSTASTTTHEPLLTSTQLKQYRDEGYTVVRGLIPVDALPPIRTELLRVEAGDSIWPDEHLHVCHPDYVKNPKGGKLVAGLQLPAKRSEAFRRVSEHANMIGAMSEILGGPVKPFTDQAGIKSRLITSEQGGRTFYHQDSYYWHIDPQLGCNCWLPLDEVGKDAIALAIIPRSQRDWKLQEHEHYFDDPPYMGGRATEPFKRHRIPNSSVDFSKEVLVPMSPGDALFFTNYTWHRSEPNYTGKTLSFYAIAYQRK